MEKKTTHIFRKEKGQIVVHGEVNLTDLEGNKIPWFIKIDTLSRPLVCGFVCWLVGWFVCLLACLVVCLFFWLHVCLFVCWCFLLSM